MVSQIDLQVFVLPSVKPSKAVASPFCDLLVTMARSSFEQRRMGFCLPKLLLRPIKNAMISQSLTAVSVPKWLTGKLEVVALAFVFFIRPLLRKGRVSKGHPPNRGLVFRCAVGREIIVYDFNFRVILNSLADVISVCLNQPILLYKYSGIGENR